MRQQLIVKGEPVAKGRPRSFVIKGTKRIGQYTPKKTVVAENLIRISWTENDPPRPKLTGCIRMFVYCYFSIPKSISKKKQMELEGKHRDKMPDVDNLIKAIMDGLNGVAFDDDKQIAECWVGKFYAQNPYTQIILEEI